MKELDLEVAGEFVAMAATLIQVKSRMLLPQYDENGEIVENEDPRKELVQRLLEYQKYQEAARALYERPLLGRDVWARGLREKLETPEENIVLDENPVFALITAYRRAVKTAKKKIHQVTAKLQSIAGRILEMKDLLIVGHKVAMSSLIKLNENRRKQILITFLSVLELGKMGFVSLFQTDVYQEIYVEARKPIETDVLSKVEEYDSIDSVLSAQNLIEKADKTTVDLSDESDEGFAEQSTVQEVIEAQQQEDFASPDEMATDEEIAMAEHEMQLAEV
jgi:segregation and condensation protein A